MQNYLDKLFKETSANVTDFLNETEVSHER